MSLIDQARRLFGLPVYEFKPNEIAVFVWSSDLTGDEPRAAALGRAMDGTECTVLKVVAPEKSFHAGYGYQVRFQNDVTATVNPICLRKRRPPEEERRELMRPVDWAACPWQPPKVKA